MAPCRCRGSMRGVHASCIESWIAARTRQRLRPELQGGDHVQPQICCDLCGEPYQAEHHPAHLCDCLKAHMRECLEQLQDELGTLGLRRVCGIVLGNCWLTCVMMGSAILVSDILKEACLGTRPWQCWLAAVLYAAFLATLMYESTVILVSFPWTDTPPTSCLRYFFLPGNQVTQSGLRPCFLHKRTSSSWAVCKGWVFLDLSWPAVCAGYFTTPEALPRDDAGLFLAACLLDVAESATGLATMLCSLQRSGCKTQPRIYPGPAPTHFV